MLLYQIGEVLKRAIVRSGYCSSKMCLCGTLDTLRRPCNPSEVLPHKRVQLIKIMDQVQLCSKVSAKSVRNQLIIAHSIYTLYFAVKL